MEYSVALVGNPNVGKTSIYNRITKSFEHVGNWHGVTVAKISKTVKLDDKIISLCDLPGLYSFTVYSHEEGISRDAVLSGANDIIVCVCDANNLHRNLYLALQLLEIGAPVILAVNMIDELKKAGKKIDSALLSERLGVPVVNVSAKNKKDTEGLKEAIVAYLNSSKPTVFPKYETDIPLDRLSALIKKSADKINVSPMYAAVKVLENDEFMIGKLNLKDSEKKAFAEIEDSQGKIASMRYSFIDKVLKDVITHKSELQGDGARLYGQSKIDVLALNKYLALPIFFAVMLLIFYLTFGLLGKALSDLLELFIDSCIFLPIQNGLTQINCPAWITALLCEGIIQGVGGILTFLPQIVLLFFFLALLEDSGYLSRVAFMTDGMFRKIGLSGRSAFTMLMGFGCSATAVLTSRGLEDDNMRKKTILITPFYSCSARLPVYSVIASAYFLNGQAGIIFFMYLLGIFVSLLIAFILEKFVKRLKSGKQSFIMEMPPYRFPTFERVWQIIANNVKVFIIRVGTVIFALNVIVWLLSNFSFTHGFVTGTEYMSIFHIIGDFVSPVFSPLGFGNWKAVTSLLSGVVAKEIVISSIESLGGVASIFSGEFAAVSALSFLTFTLLYVPCIATLTAIKKELNLKWMFISLGLQLAVAYVFSLIVYQLGVLFVLNLGLAVGILIILVVAVIVFFVLASMIKNKKACPYGCSDCSDCAKKDK